MIKVICNCKDFTCEVLYDPSEDIETLKFQILSMSDDMEDPLIIDFTGRVILTLEDLEDIKLLDEPQKSSDNIFRGSSNNLISSRSSNVNISESSLGCDTTVYVWVIDKKDINHDNICTYDISSSIDLIQPSYRIIDTDFRICMNCSKMLSFDLIEKNTSALSLFTCSRPELEKIGLISTSSIPIHKNKINDPSDPIKLFLIRNLFNQSLQLQRNLNNVPKEDQQLRSLEARINSNLKSVLIYEDYYQQKAAREVIDYQKIKEYSMEYKIQQHETIADDIVFVQGLLKWFKVDFFKWCDKPNCGNLDCEVTLNPSKAQAQAMEAIGVESPNEDEKINGWSGRTEIYRCNHCLQITRFPRLNNPSVLLKTKKGRCGEFANVFCLICRALSFDTRYVLDLTDHVWVEIWIPSLKRYVHADPCEQTLDAPLMYKMINYNANSLFIYLFINMFLFYFFYY